MSSNTPSQPEFDLLDADTKEWIDSRASWLLDQFSWQRIQSCNVILPTAEFFPGPFNETEDGAKVLLAKLCGFLGIRAYTVELSLFYEEDRIDGGETALGLYQRERDRNRIWIEVKQLSEPLQIAATMAHELGHVHLLGHGRLTEESDDHEPLTDLLTVFLGLGVITANAALSDVNWQFGGWEGWSIGRHGYLTMPMYGYALALFAGVRGEHNPSWSKHLRPDVRRVFKKGQEYIAKHGLPDLRTVRTTLAQPRIAHPDSPGDDAEHAPPEETESEIGLCSYCGATLADPDALDGICEECQISIEENQVELETEQREDELTTRRNQWLFKWVCFSIIVLVIVVILLEWFGVTGK